MSLAIKNSQELVNNSPSQRIGYRGCPSELNAHAHLTVRLQRRSSAASKQQSLTRLSNSLSRSHAPIAIDPANSFLQTTRYKAVSAPHATEAPGVAQRSLPRSTSSFVNQVVKLTNAARRKAGLKPLKVDSRLMAAAQGHSQDMGVNDFYDHTGSNGSSAFDRMNAAGYRYTSAAENIGAGYATPAAAMKGWLSSSDHRNNILNPGLKDIGIGFYFVSNDGGKTDYEYYWTQNFGTAAGNRRNQRRSNP